MQQRARPPRTLVVAKSGIMLLSKLINTAMGACSGGRCMGGGNFSWLPFGPRDSNLTLCAYRGLLRDSSWTKVVVYRDPMERFLSAYSGSAWLEARPLLATVRLLPCLGHHLRPLRLSHDP